MFCIAWAAALVFLVVMLRPIVREAKHEMRRVAELLSQLPPEVDCLDMVTAVVTGDQAASKGKGAVAAGPSSMGGGFKGNDGSVKHGRHLRKRGIIKYKFDA